MELQLSHTQGISLSRVPEKYRQDIVVFNRWLGGRSVSPDIVELYFKEMKMVYRGDTLRKKKAALKMAIIETQGASMTALGHYELDRFFKKIKTPKTEEKVYPDEVLSLDELRQLKEASGNKTWLIIESLYLTACRVSELINIRLIDIEKRKDSVLISVKGKGQKYRSVYLPIDVYKSIRKAYRGKEYLFESPQQKDGTPQPLSRFTIHKMIKKAGAKIGRPDIHAHTARHSWASHRLKDLGIDAVSEYLGHASAETSAKYYLHNKPSVEKVLNWERI